MEHQYHISPGTRTLALIFSLAILAGNSLPELGNLTTLWLGIEKAHYFNIYFLVVGILGVIISSVALYRGLRRSNTV